jgi:hypothetical protein
MDGRQKLSHRDRLLIQITRKSSLSEFSLEGRRVKLTLDLPSGTSPDALRGYCLFYQLERWLREMVYLELKAHFGENWWTEAEQALKRSRGGGIPAARSLRADKRHPHMSTPENDPLWFLSFDSLTKIILDKKLWRLFASYLTTKSLIRARFDEISPIRNRIAHYRALHKDDIDRVVGWCPSSRGARQAKVSLTSRCRSGRGNRQRAM